MRKLIFVLLFLMQFSATELNAQQTVTGTYRYKDDGRSNEIKVLQTKSNEIKVSFEGTYQRQMPGEYLNTTTGDIPAETIKLEKGRAVLGSEYTAECRVILTFTKGVLEAVQKNPEDCQFPIGIDATGVYRRISAKVPQFIYSSTGIAPDAIVEDLASQTSNSSSKRVRFPKGAERVMVAGNTAGGATVFYLVAARAGQTIDVDLFDYEGVSNKVVISVAGKNGAGLKVDDESSTSFTGQTLKTSDYIITVNPTGTQNTNFLISLSIR